MADRYQAMELFVRVVETGSFSAAARLLRVGQPAISKSVATLEDRLGVRLLVRSTRRLQPTDAGQAFYERALRALAETEEAETAARGLGRSLDGRLRVLCPRHVRTAARGPEARCVLAAFPKLALELVMDDRPIDLLSENIDLALRFDRFPDCGLSGRRLASSGRQVVATETYLKRHGIPREPDELLQHDILVYAQAAGGEEWVFRKGRVERTVRLTGRLTFTAAEGVREAVLSGLGLAIASRWMMAPELDSNTVIPVLEDWNLPAIELWAVFPAGRLPTARARAFLDWLAPQIR